MTERRSLAARARASISFLQTQHYYLRRGDGEPHPTTDECDCGLAEACQVIVELLEERREATELLEGLCGRERERQRQDMTGGFAVGVQRVQDILKDAPRQECENIRKLAEAAVMKQPKDCYCCAVTPLTCRVCKAVGRVSPADKPPPPPVGHEPATDEFSNVLRETLKRVADADPKPAMERQSGWVWGELTPEAQREYADAGLGPLGAAGKGRPLSEMVDLEPGAVWGGEVAPFVTMEMDAGEAAMTTMEDDRGAKDKD